jgi:hypothetical protein
LPHRDIADALSRVFVAQMLTEFLLRREMPRWANNGLMHRSKQATSFDNLVGILLRP